MRQIQSRFLLITAILTVLAAGAFYTSQILTAKSDVFYLHFLGYHWFEGDRAQQALEQHAGIGAAERRELVRREHSAANYPVAAVSHYLGSRLFPDDFTLAVAFGLCLPFVAGVAVAAAGLLQLPEMDVPVALAVAVMALAGFLPGPAPSDHLLYHAPIENLFNIVVLVISPGEAFSPLSIWPKSTLALLLVAALACRWSGRVGAGYVMLAAAIPFHLTLGGLLLLAFAAMDRALRPEQVPLRWSALAAGGACVAAALGQWRIAAGGAFGMELIGTLAVTVLAIFLAWRTRHAIGRRMGIVAADTGALLLAAVLFTPAAMLMVGVSGAGADVSAPVSIFVQLAARLIVLAATVLLFAFAVRAAGWLESRQATAAAATFAGLACLFTIYGAMGSWWWESRFLPARMHDTSARAASEPLTPVYHDALKDLMNGQWTKAP